MTDKQLEQKRREFFDEFGFSDNWGNILDRQWEWIEKLVEEVEREGYKKGLIDQSIRDVTN